jgi:two-component sensor histidine kinase
MSGNQPVSAPEAGSSRERGPILARALANAGILVLYQRPDLKFVWVEEGPAAWWTGSPVGLTDHDILPRPDAEHVARAKRRCLAEGKPERVEARIIVPGHDSRWFDLWIDPDHDANGVIVGLITTAVEITEQKQREQTLRALLREVSHRSRNMLAIIQGIASQTSRYALTPEAFLDRFRARLQSLAESQDLVTSSNWRGADLRDLVVGQSRRYVDNPSRSIRIEGLTPFLNPNAALHIGLALHELIVNSVSYGALADAAGSVTLAVEREPESHDVVLTWRETVPPGSSSANSRFGSVTLQRVVPTSLNGNAELKIDGGELTYRLRVPAGSLEAA